jgi:hypothetical protein
MLQEQPKEKEAPPISPSQPWHAQSRLEMEENKVAPFKDLKPPPLGSSGTEASPPELDKSWRLNIETERCGFFAGEASV